MAFQLLDSDPPEGTGRASRPSVTPPDSAYAAVSSSGEAPTVVLGRRNEREILDRVLTGARSGHGQHDRSSRGARNWKVHLVELRDRFGSDCRAEYSAANEALSMARLFCRDLTGPACAQLPRSGEAVRECQVS
jgi:hypothetical protein